MTAASRSNPILKTAGCCFKPESLVNLIHQTLRSSDTSFTSLPFVFLSHSVPLFLKGFFDVCLQWLIDACRGLLSALSQGQMNKWIDHLCRSERPDWRKACYLANTLGCLEIRKAETFSKYSVGSPRALESVETNTSAFGDCFL